MGKRQKRGGTLPWKILVKSSQTMSEILSRSGHSSFTGCLISWVFQAFSVFISDFHHLRYFLLQVKEPEAGAKEQQGSRNMNKSCIQTAQSVEMQDTAQIRTLEVQANKSHTVIIGDFNLHKDIWSNSVVDVVSECIKGGLLYQGVQEPKRTCFF